MIQAIIAASFLALSAPFGELFGDLRVGEDYVKEAALELKCGDEVVKGQAILCGQAR